MATPGQLIENSAAVSYFDSVVRNSAWAQQVYHTNNRHYFGTDGITAGTGEYSGVNPGSGASVAGVGNDGTIVYASSVYNHLRDASYNLTHIRQSAAYFYRNQNGSWVYRGVVGPRVTVRPTSQRQGFPNVNNAGVSAGSIAYASSFNNYCTNLYNQWNSLKNNRSDFNVYYCHTSCHSSCHSSRGRR